MSFSILCDFIVEITICKDIFNCIFSIINQIPFTIKKYSIPNTVKIISNNVFTKCQNLEKVIITDNSVETIGVSAFSYCNELIIINFPSSIKNIGKEAFLECNKLRCGLKISNLSSIYYQLVASKIPLRCIEKCPYTMIPKTHRYYHPLLVI